MQISCFTVGPFAENTYLLTKGGDALIVDPGFAEESEYNKVKAAIIDGEYTLKAVVLTHAHVDHVLGLHRVLNDFEVPVFLNDRDRYLWNNFAPQAAMFGFKEDEFTITPEPLSE
ncbi:MAG: MBL fold metallo-hydrolase, partial [Balneolaceae bacterium]